MIRVPAGEVGLLPVDGVGDEHSHPDAEPRHLFRDALLLPPRATLHVVVFERTETLRVHEPEFLAPATIGELTEHAEVRGEVAGERRRRVLCRTVPEEGLAGRGGPGSEGCRPQSRGLSNEVASFHGSLRVLE